MITATDKKTIIKHFGNKYSRKIIPILTEKGITNSKGLPYSPRSLQHIVNGLENLEVEKAIFRIINDEKIRQKKLAIYKKEVKKM